MPQSQQSDELNAAPGADHPEAFPAGARNASDQSTTHLPATNQEWVFGRWTTPRIVVWIVLTICVSIPLAPPFFRWFSNQGGTIMDYYQEWSSVRSVILRQPVYRPTREFAQRDFGKRFNTKAPWNLGYNVHPPTSVLLALPFGYLSYFNSFYAWSVFTLALFGLSLYLIARNSGYLFGWWSVLPITCGCLLSSPFWHQFQQGQLNPLILFFITLGWLNLRSKHIWQTGLWLGLAAAVKAFPAFLGLYFLLRREWKYLAALILFFTFATLVTVAALGLETYTDYVKFVLPEALEWRSANTNASLSGLWCKLFDPGTRGGVYIPLLRSPLIAKTLTLLSWVIVLGGVVQCWQRARSQREIDLAFGLALVAMLLLSPVTWDHYFLLLPLPLLTIWMNLPPTRTYQFIFLSVLAGLGAPVYNWITLTLPQGENVAGVRPLQAIGLPTLSCYLLCALFILGHIAARHSSESRRNATHLAT